MADAFTENIRGVSLLVEDSTNKITQGGMLPDEGVTGEKIDVLDLPMEDKELLALRNDWEKKYGPYEGKIKETFDRNLRSYLGRTKNGSVPDYDEPTAANLQFESEETFLPAALARNPDPVVWADDSPEGNAIADKVKTMLQFHSEQLLLKRKLEVMVRQWSIYQLAVLKPGWDAKINDVAIENRRIRDFIFDPDGYVDVYGDFTSWLGERITVSAEKLIELFPKKEDEITKAVMGADGRPDLGTPCTYTEWWNDDYCFSTFKNVVLDKHKNEYFNYPNEEEKDEVTGEPLKKPINHFAVPKKPYIFLSIFSLQERPHDITGLIEQNIPNQNKISRRVEQIDTNVSKSNNSELYSENNFNQETAKQAAVAIKDPNKGQVLIPPGGPIGEAIVRLPAPGFPEAAFKDLENSENHLRSSWGVQGIISQPPKPDETARGMILNQGRDTSRIGGGISDVVEQSVARSAFNWLLQLYCVFYDEKHFGSVMGIGKAVQYAELINSDVDRQLIVGVAPNSMMPKDETSRANMAQNLFEKGAIGPKILLETLSFPNADDAAADGILYKSDPKAYIQLNFPELWAQLNQMAMVQAQQNAGVQPPAQGVPPQAPATEPASAQMAQVPMPK